MTDSDLVLDTEAISSDNKPLPELYSPQAIRGFSLVFSSLFGGILFCINLKRSGKSAQIPLVLAMTVVYFILAVIVASYLPSKSTSISFLVNFPAAWLLSTIAWDRLLGKGLQYTTRKIWIPLLIGLGIAALFIALFVLTYQS
jgi:hypothetical protein